MPEAGRLGDKAQCSADAHGCLGCAHSVAGPVVGGSPDVFVNAMPAARAGDPGVHSGCCGPNTWNAHDGSDTVYANGKPLHRKGDATRHCGGIGKLIEGSPNVFAGGGGPSAPPLPPGQRYDQGFVVVHGPSGFPLRALKYVIKTRTGAQIRGATSREGRTVRVLSEVVEQVEVDVSDRSGGER